MVNKFGSAKKKVIKIKLSYFSVMIIRQLFENVCAKRISTKYSTLKFKVFPVLLSNRFSNKIKNSKCSKQNLECHIAFYIVGTKVNKVIIVEIQNKSYISLSIHYKHLAQDLRNLIYKFSLYIQACVTYVKKSHLFFVSKR